MMVERDEYKGQPMIVFKKSDGDKYPFRFGLKKALIILENLGAIKTFVEDHKDKVAEIMVSMEGK